MITLQIPDYRIVRELGSGAMGIVYEAVHIKLARRVAIKVVRPKHARDPELEARFVNEARALARVCHPSIVLIFEFGVLPDGSAYLVMELLQGENLELRWQKRQRTANPRTELLLIQQLAHALSLLHSHGVVHRDLKPANVMVTTEPGPIPVPRARLVDFGLAKLIRLSGSKTASSLIMGTPAYMSPEQCRGAGLVGAKTDCYALGVMLYELVAGILPFESAWAGDLIGMHIHLEPPPLTQLEPNVDPRLAALVHALLRNDQHRRPAMADVAKYLLALIDQLDQQIHQPLPSLEPEVDPFEETRAANEVAITAPAQMPAIASTEPAVPAAPPAARRAMFGLGVFQILILVGVLLIIINISFVNSENNRTIQSNEAEKHELQLIYSQGLIKKLNNEDMGKTLKADVNMEQDQKLKSGFIVRQASNTASSDDSIPTIKDALAKAKPAFLRCYSPGSPAPGKFSVDITVGPDGRVVAASAVETVNKQTICLVDILRGLHCAPPRDFVQYRVEFGGVRRRP